MGRKRQRVTVQELELQQRETQEMNRGWVAEEHLGLPHAAYAPPVPMSSTLCKLPTSRPYDVEGLDHCETPAEAYSDVVPLLNLLAEQLGKRAEALRIYDPYFCAGTVRTRLREVGFSNVINENRDFYGDINAKPPTVPEFDVMLTNPPFSGDHMAKLLRFASGSCKPYLLLLPNYVCLKPFYKRALATGELAEALSSVLLQ
jgi:hypothetical protein